jgi:hypothetical protein
LPPFASLVLRRVLAPRRSRAGLGEHDRILKLVRALRLAQQLLGLGLDDEVGLVVGVG